VNFAKEAAIAEKMTVALRSVLAEETTKNATPRCASIALTNQIAKTTKCFRVAAKE
jgi:hypothetical protein